MKNINIKISLKEFILELREFLKQNLLVNILVIRFY